MIAEDSITDTYDPIKKVLDVAGIKYTQVPVMDSVNYLDITTNAPYDLHLWLPEAPDDAWTITYHKRGSDNPVWDEAHVISDAPLSDVVTMVHDIITEFGE